MKGSRRVLVKVVLFQLRGRGHPQDDATPNLLILNALHKGFQIKYHLFQKFFGKMVKIKETSFLFTRQGLRKLLKSGGSTPKVERQKPDFGRNLSIMGGWGQLTPLLPKV